MSAARPSFLLLLTTAALLLAGCDQAEQTKAPPPPAVSVYTVQTNAIGNYREFVARTEASQEVLLQARVEGEITQINFTEGTTVEKGQLLFEIDPKPYQAALTRAKADLAASQASAKQAAADYKRGQELLPRGYISQADIDKLRAAALQTEASVDAAKASLETAELNVGYTHITAPFTGKIGKQRYDLGTLVGPTSEPLAELSAANPIFVNFQLEESTYTHFLQHRASLIDPETGEPPLDLSLRLPNNGTYSEAGKLNFTDTRIDSAVGSVNLRAVFPNPDGIILPGLYVTLVIESRDKTEMPLIPQAAVQENQLGKFVLVLTDDNTIERRIVEMDRRIGAMWSVKSGLEAGEKIVIEGLQKVRPGVTVAPVEKRVDPKTGAVSDLESEDSQAPAPSEQPEQ